jgi:hypothetical protein
MCLLAVFLLVIYFSVTPSPFLPALPRLRCRNLVSGRNSSLNLDFKSEISDPQPRFAGKKRAEY